MAQDLANQSPPGKLDLAQQMEQNEGERTPRSSVTGTARMSPKPRSLSDAPKPGLSPSPAFREPIRLVSKDDSVLASPSTPRRSTYHVRGLSLQMPMKEPLISGSSTVVPRIPLSPKLDSSHTYGSPGSMLPRRSRGLDYTRACTNLHHSTLAESSPDASPITGRGIQIPQRRSMGSTVLDSPSNMGSSLWSTMPNDRTTLSSSVSSINMLDSDSDSESSSDDMALDRDNEDAMLHTPAASRLNGNLISSILNSPGAEWMNAQPSPAQASLMNFQPSLMSFRRARPRKRKSQHSSSSVSMNSSKPSPGPLSPNIMKSVESAGGSYFATGLNRRQVQSRRESLSLGTDDLHLSDSEDGANKTNGAQSYSDMDGSNLEEARNVVRRAVTRRGNLLPKTKGFARIRAALMEESSPLDNEVKREAEVIRQVHENEPTVFSTAQATFTAEPIQSSIEDNGIDPEATTQTKPSLTADSFSRHAEKHSAGLGFWQAFDDRYRTPPPTLLPRESSSAISDENMETTASLIPTTAETLARKQLDRSRSRSSTPLAAQNPPTANDVARRVNNKRRRDDDLDQNFIKRRAVSPGMSVQSSPVLPQSPVMSSDKGWGKPPPKTNGHGDRSNSGGSMNGVKKFGLNGMSETSEGFMSMSID